MRSFVLASIVAMAASGAFGQGKHPAAEYTLDVEDCIKSAAGSGQPMSAAEMCIARVSDPCLKDAKSTADMNGCSDSEKAVWDNILNETYRQLREKLVGEQQEKLRDMQRAWIASRDKTCAFYWDYYQGTMASPMAAACVNRETAQRAQFLVGFLYATKDK
jgi:uncharacterized protein YecT (DUF1311 family)